MAGKHLSILIVWWQLFVRHTLRKSLSLAVYVAFGSGASTTIERNGWEAHNLVRPQRKRIAALKETVAWGTWMRAIAHAPVVRCTILPSRNSTQVSITHRRKQGKIAYDRSFLDSTTEEDSSNDETNEGNTANTDSCDCR